MRTLFVDLGVVCMLLVAVGVSVVFGSYEDGQPDTNSMSHGDNVFWVNHGDVAAWYCRPRQYCKESHFAYSRSGWPVSVISCEITFTGKYGSATVYQDSWSNDGALSESNDYNEGCTSAITDIYTWYFNILNGDYWDDYISVGVIAGVQP